MKSWTSVVPVLQRVAGHIGARVDVDPQGTDAGCIVFATGRRSYFWYNRFELNTTPVSRICQDKALTAHFLSQCGFRVPAWMVICSDSIGRFGDRNHDIEAGWNFARQTGLPVVAKPLFLSKGAFVHVVRSEEEYRTSVNAIFAAMGARGAKRLAVVQSFCSGREHRIVVLDGEVIAAYWRSALSIVGDGTSSVDGLLASLLRQFEAQGRDPGELPAHDTRIDATLSRNGLERASVLESGRQVTLLDVANLSLGGTAHDCVGDMHPAVKKLACRIAAALHLSFCGIDIFIEDIRNPATTYAIIEVNSAPGLDDAVFHGEEQERRVDELYLKVLVAIERRAELFGFDAPGDLDDGSGG